MDTVFQTLEKAVTAVSGFLMDIVIFLYEALSVFEIVSLLFVAVGLLFTIHHFRILRAVSYIERFNSPDMVPVREKVDTWLESDKPDEEKIREADSDPALRIHIRVFMNIFIELGIACRYGLVDWKVTRRIWNFLIPHYWDKLYFYRTHTHRKKKNWEHYDSFARLHKRLQRYQKMHDLRKKITARIFGRFDSQKEEKPDQDKSEAQRTERERNSDGT